MEAIDAKTVRRIVLLLKRPSSVAHLHIFGLNSSPVRSTYRAVLTALKEEKCIVLPVNCLLVNGSLQYFCSELLSKLPSYSNTTRVNSLDDLFTTLLSEFDNQSSSRSIVIAISRAEQLLKFPNNFAIGFFRCLKRDGGKIKSLTLSHVPWSKIETVSCLSNCVEIPFKSFDKGDLNALLKKQFAGEKTDVKVAVDLNYSVCRNLDLLKHMIKGQQRQKDITEAKGKKLKSRVTDLLADSKTDSSKLALEHVDLPKNEIVLLLAAYCASYNPASSDGRIFGQTTTKSKAVKEAVRWKKKEVIERIPKSFDFQRLYFIYLTLLRFFGLEQITTSEFALLVNDLCSLGHMVKTSADGALDMLKYKCMTSDEIIHAAARTMGETDFNNFLFTG